MHSATSRGETLAIIPTTNPTKDPIGKAVTTSASGSTTTNLRGDFNAEIRYFLHFDNLI